MKKLNLSRKELEALYRIVKSYESDSPEDSDYFDDSIEEDFVEEEIVVSILGKISEVMPEEDREYIDKEFLRMKYHTFNNEIDGGVYKIVEKAFKRLKTIEIEYFSVYDADFKKRKIDVYHKSKKYVIGYCHLRRAMRKFRTSRIASAKLTSGGYKIPDDFDKKNY